MNKKIGLISPNYSQYDVMFYFIKALHGALIKHGVDAHLYRSTQDALESFKSDAIDLYMGFNGVPFVDLKTFPHIVNKPFFSLLVDPFYRFIDLSDIPLITFGCDDFLSVTYLNQIKANKAVFVPHAADDGLKPSDFPEKKYDVSFMGTFIDYEKRSNEWSEKYPKKVVDIMFQVVEEAFVSDYSFIEIALTKLSSLESENYNILNALKDIELYIKGKERLDLIKSIKTLQVDIFGGSTDENSWKNYFQSQKNVVVHDPVSYIDSLELEKNSKIVLNSSLKNKYGAHERVFSSLSLGALAFTSQNSFLDQYFTDDLSIGYFNHQSLSSLEDQISIYLKNEDKRRFVAENGRDIVLQHHTWGHRAQTIIEFINKHV